MRRSAEAEKERKRRVKAERERKRVKSPEEERWEKLGGEGKTLGNEEDAEDRVVPPSDNPWSLSSSRGGDAWAADGMRRRTTGR